jgi:hypothetical protein
MVLRAAVSSARLFKGFQMNENAMMKKMGRGKAKMDMQEMFGKKKPAAKKPAMKMAKPKAYAKGGAVGGCEIKGNKKATMVKMAGGGKTC